MTQIPVPRAGAIARPPVITAEPAPETDLPPARKVELAPLRTRISILIAVTLPLVGVIAAALLLWGVAFSWVYLALLAGMYVLTAFGITIGYHRLFTHKSFETFNWVRYFWGAMGSMAVQGPVLQWAANHRRHHQHSDHNDDPHSPHTEGHGFMGFIKGVWHAHMGWLFEKDSKELPKYIKDLRDDPVAKALHRQFPIWMLVGLLLPAVLGGLFTMSWLGAALGLTWGGLVRIFLVHHVTWSVNSVCHIWGARPFDSHDESRNNPVFGILAMGEGWHNNHHAFPASARHGLFWWQFDASWVMIWLMRKTGLAWKVRLPDPERVELKRK